MRVGERRDGMGYGPRVMGACMGDLRRMLPCDAAEILLRFHEITEAVT